MTNSEAVKLGKFKGEKRAKIEYLLNFKKITEKQAKKTKELAKAGARTKFTGKQLNAELAKIDNDFNNGMKILNKQIDLKIDKLMKKKVKKDTGKVSKITKIGKQFVKDVTGGVGKTWKKIPAKGPIAIGGSVLVAAVAAATYKRYKTLEKERLERAQKVIAKRFEAKLKKYS